MIVVSSCCYCGKRLLGLSSPHWTAGRKIYTFNGNLPHGIRWIQSRPSGVGRAQPIVRFPKQVFSYRCFGNNIIASQLSQREKIKRNFLGCAHVSWGEQHRSRWRAHALSNSERLDSSECQWVRVTPRITHSNRVGRHTEHHRPIIGN